MTASQLRRLFDDCNRRFFCGRKPHYRISTAQRDWTPGHRGECLTERRIIFVRADLPDDEQRCVLLHEMCHIGCPGHGRRFQERLQRLSDDHGEAWAAKEAADYRDRRFVPSNRWLRQTITDLALEQPDLPWIVARRLLANEACSRPNKFERTFPWARAAWLHDSREQRADRLRARAFQSKTAALPK